jgi:hypothetical protein
VTIELAKITNEEVPAQRLTSQSKHSQQVGTL